MRLSDWPRPQKPGWISSYFFIILYMCFMKCSISSCPCSDLLNQFFPTMQRKNINLCTTLLGFLLIHHLSIVSVFNQGLNCIGLHKQAASFWHHKTKTTSHIPTFASPLQMVSNGFYPDGFIPCVIPGYRSEKLVLLFFLLDLSCHKLMH